MVNVDQGAVQNFTIANTLAEASTKMLAQGSQSEAPAVGVPVAS